MRRRAGLLDWSKRGPHAVSQGSGNAECYAGRVQFRHAACGLKLLVPLGRVAALHGPWSKCAGCLTLSIRRLVVLAEESRGEQSRVMRYKGYNVTVTVEAFGIPNPCDPKFTVRCDDVLVHEGSVQGQFPDHAAAEDAAYSAAREWIEAKCRVN